MHCIEIVNGITSETTNYLPKLLYFVPYNGTTATRLVRVWGEGAHEYMQLL